MREGRSISSLTSTWKEELRSSIHFGSVYIEDLIEASILLRRERVADYILPCQPLLDDNIVSDRFDYKHARHAIQLHYKQLFTYNPPGWD